MSYKIISIPVSYSFKHHDLFVFDDALSIFDWDITNENVVIDLSQCRRANYQALSLLVLYIWHLRTNKCDIKFNFSDPPQDASIMWRLMGAMGWSQVLYNETQNFNGVDTKPLIAIRSQRDFGLSLSKVENYVKDFNIEYEKTLRYVISELLYNTIEHGRVFFRQQTIQKRIPSIIQFTWYRKKNELQFLVADIGIGIKRHLEQYYPAFDNDEIAIRTAIRPHVSGAFRKAGIYERKDNAGVGLFLSSNIVRRLNADMHIVSGNGLVHISPRDITSQLLKYSWPGTFVLVNVKLNQIPNFSLHNMMSEFRDAALKEIRKTEQQVDEERYYLSINNYFGPFAEDKEAAINYRDKYLLGLVDSNKVIVLDFENVKSAPHSFLSALLATAISQMGIAAFKRIKIVNAEPEIRETIDYILDENTN
jgi:hypothetical protein